ncbi:putative germin-like protein 2-1 [Iris pallida]|uniref:Germin-like protein n=1 Tax=Iris pallida TaxID=29817 RepID=A0AAX6ENS8_IRIPA|nr:putative germin-like protein 2-1 [Iris pallida]
MLMSVHLYISSNTSFILFYSRIHCTTPSANSCTCHCITSSTFLFTYAAVFVNGLVCEDPKLAKPEDFFFAGLNKPGNTSNPLGSMVTPVAAGQLPGLNTLGISLARIDFEPYGLNPPHTHPRATEILTVLEGSLYVGFVTSNPGNRLFAKVLRKGDVFVFPQGLVHFQLNSGEGDAVAIAALSSQNPGVITVANAVFGAKPPILDDVLAKAFKLDKKTVDWLQAQLWMDNN